jgi:Na+/proline symporter
MNVWFRRVRLTTMADLFEDRFGRRFLATLYAVVAIITCVFSIAFGNIIALKTLEPIMVKAPAAYTPAEQRAIADYAEFIALRKQRKTTPLEAATARRYEELKAYYDRGKLLPYVSYLKPLPFYVSSSALVAIFIMVGGLSAAAVVDAIQTILVIFISFVLIPFGLSRVGGVHALHQIVPEEMFNIFGGSTSQYTWFSIAALIFLTIIGINAAQGNMNISGSAKDEMAARLGAIGGGFAKRFVSIGWGFCGLLAIGIFGRTLSDPDQAWGLLSRTLLPVGMLGMMIVGLLGGKMSGLGASSIVVSALVVKNLYEPMFPGKSEAHYVRVARLTIPVMLILGVAVALTLTSAISALMILITLGVAWGAPMLLIFMWRRLTEIAVRIEVITCLVYMVVIPMVVSLTPALRQSPALTGMTADVSNPVSIYFEDGVAPVIPGDPNSPKEGLGRFNIEIYFVHLLGVNVRNFSPGMLLGTRFLVNGALPLVMLIALSLVTKRSDPERVLRFHVRMKTPVQPTLEEDHAAVQESYANPTRYDHTKLFPGSDWEFTKWDRIDTLGFFGCCGGVAVVLLVFHIVMVIGA